MNQVKKANQPKDVQLRPRFHADQAADPPAARSTSTAANPPAAVKQGEKQELAVKIERLYGFAEQVELTLRRRRRACRGCRPSK